MFSLMIGAFWLDRASNKKCKQLIKMGLESIIIGIAMSFYLYNASNNDNYNSLNFYHNLIFFLLIYS